LYWFSYVLLFTVLCWATCQLGCMTLQSSPADCWATPTEDMLE